MSDPVPTPTTDPQVTATAAGNPFARAIAAAVIAGLTAATTALTTGDDGISPAEWVAIAISFLVTGAAVWAVPTMPEGIRAHGKAITAAVVSALGVLGTGLADGHLEQPEILMVITALLSGLVVSQVPELKSGKIADPLVAGTTGPTGPSPRRSTDL